MEGSTLGTSNPVQVKNCLSLISGKFGNWKLSEIWNYTLLNCCTKKINIALLQKLVYWGLLTRVILCLNWRLLDFLDSTKLSMVEAMFDLVWSSELPKIIISDFKIVMKTSLISNLTFTIKASLFLKTKMP